jgi:hypothetical protein
MANKNFTCPPQPATGAGTFSDNLVGFQLVAGGGLTQGNFEFTTALSEKVNRTFTTGTFSTPINLEGLGLSSVDQSKSIFENNFKVYPNFDLTQVTNFTTYGSMVKRISTSVETIISKFPAALEVTFMDENYVTGDTATNIIYNPTTNETNFDLIVSRIRNPFDIDFSVNSTRNLQLREIQVSELRNMTIAYAKYSLYYNGAGYDVKQIVPTTTTSSGTLKIFVNGNPFSGETSSFDNIIVRPNDHEVGRVFSVDLDEVQRFLLNRNISPIYTAVFKVPMESEDGSYYINNENVTWPLMGNWNLDILTNSFTNYLTTLNDISASFDSYQTNLVSRFLTTDSFREFDTTDQKVQKVLQIYGRSFDETKKFINALAYMNSVNYNTGNDIPSQLLKNLAQTLGWDTNISPITNDDFLNSVFGQKNNDKSSFTGVAQSQTPDELNYNYYNNLILNSAYLFKSKGTRKSIETLMRMIGAPDALVEFNEYIYLADQKINVNEFNSQFANISGGTYSKSVPVLDPTNVFSIMGSGYTGFTTVTQLSEVNLTIEDYPIDNFGYPKSPENTDSYFFQMGSGWFESTPKHRSPEQVDLTNSVFTGSNPNYQTKLIPFSYGQEYLNVYKKLPYTTLGFNLREIVDNNKSWVDTEIGERINFDAGFDSSYNTSSDNLVINVKNIDLFLNPSQGLLYDVWFMSNQYNYPIPNEGLNYVQPTYCDPNPVSIYPSKGDVDWTVINPQPKNKSFFEFAQTFWLNTINVRNRQFATDGGTSGYPTLSSIYWRYLESENIVGIANDNFTYDTMIQYVEGMGDYWVRLVEQMIPASTIWNTGVKLENSIFHRQKFVWRRQRGCQFIPVICNPCTLTTSIYNQDCPRQSTKCDVYPKGTTNFNEVLNSVVNQYISDNELIGCSTSSISSQWFVNIVFNNVEVYNELFFEGTGWNSVDCGTPLQSSSPCNTQWLTNLRYGLESLQTLGLDYYFNDDNTTVTIFNTNCANKNLGWTVKINVGLTFAISCL